MKERSLSRAELLAAIGTAPIAIGAFAALTAEADADTNNKRTFKYRDKPGPKGARCSGCSLFVAPNACQVVHGKISPNGWCTAYTPRL